MKARKKSTPQVATSLPVSPDDDRKSRMVKYTIAMLIRVACIIAMLFVQGWWLLVFAAGAILLPYFAVLVANIQGPPRTDSVVRPGGVAKRQHTTPDWSSNE